MRALRVARFVVKTGRGDFVVGEVRGEAGARVGDRNNKHFDKGYHNEPIVAGHSGCSG